MCIKQSSEQFIRWLVVISCLAWFANSAIAEETESAEFDNLLTALVDANFSTKENLAQSIADSGNNKSEAVLVAMLEGNLYVYKINNRLVFAQSMSEGYELIDVLSDQVYQIESKQEISKIRVNNSLRGQLSILISGLRLKAEDPSRRLAAAVNILRNPDPALIDLVDKAYKLEKNKKVRQALSDAQAAIDLVVDTVDREARLAAIARLADVPDKAVINLLSRFTLKDEEGAYLETDEEIRTAAISALKQLNARAGFYSFFENLFFGISLGSVLLLAAVGLAITFGVMGVINMAHGEMIMLGAYTTYVVQLWMPNQIGVSLLVAVPAAFLVSGVVGVCIERSIIRHLYGRPLETLLATFGISLILQQLVRTIFSPLNRSVLTPEWMSGSWEINGMLSLTFNRLYIIFFSLMVLGSLVLLMQKTFVGLQMRAVTQNRAMASSMGIKTGWVDALTFGLGSGIAGIAGVALSQLTNVGPNLGQGYIIDSFLVVVFGGVGNLFGTFFAAMSLGIANKFAEPLAGAVLAKILILIFIILFIQRKPRGLFAIKGRFVED